VEPLVPALTSLYAKDFSLGELAGVRCDAGVTLYVGDNCCGRHRGELQITSYGISGIVVFQLSRFASYGALQRQKMRCSLDFMPEMDEIELRQYIEQVSARQQEKLTLYQCCIGMLHPKLLSFLCAGAGISQQQKLVDCSEKQFSTFLRLIKDYSVDIKESGSMKSAQVTAGGVSLAEVDAKTMESTLVPGLFFAGELLDVDGMCGGYNLQWAWTSGRIAGTNAGKRKVNDSN
jgi:hypothetical protein